jgi:ribosome-associated heat shock protein Hsp15
MGSPSLKAAPPGLRFWAYHYAVVDVDQDAVFSNVDDLAVQVFGYASGLWRCAKSLAMGSRQPSSHAVQVMTDSTDNPTPPTPIGTQRLDKWLWFARVVKTRTVAAALVSGGKVRVNKVKAEKPALAVRPGDVLTISLHSYVRILEVLQPGEKRGDAQQAAVLFKDLTPPAPPRERTFTEAPDGARAEGSGRPTKRDRRLTDKWKDLA